MRVKPKSHSYSRIIHGSKQIRSNSSAKTQRLCFLDRNEPFTTKNCRNRGEKAKELHTAKILEQYAQVERWMDRGMEGLPGRIRGSGWLRECQNGVLKGSRRGGASQGVHIGDPKGSDGQSSFPPFSPDDLSDAVRCADRTAVDAGLACGNRCFEFCK